MRNNKLTIIFSNSNPKELWGGGEKWMLDAASGLVSRGHRIIVAARKNSILIERAKERNLETKQFNIHMDFDPLKIVQIVWFLKKEKVDVIILNINKDVRVAGIAAHIANTPVILARHGAKLISDKLKHRLTMSLVDGIITNSRTRKQEYESYKWMPNNKIEVIYNGINIPANKPKLDLKEKYNIPKNHIIFGAVGRLQRVKGFDTLINASIILLKRNLPITLLIAGKGKLRNELQNIIHRERVTDKIRLVGFWENPLDFINSIDIFVLSSRSEGMPNVIMEAMALKKIVIATNVGGINEIISNNENGFLVEPNNIDVLASAMEMMLKQNKNLGKICENAFNTIQEKFTLGKTIDHLEHYFYKKYNLSSRHCKISQ